MSQFQLFKQVMESGPARASASQVAITDSSTGTVGDTLDPMIAGGTGQAAGGWDTAGNRDTSIAAINDNFAILADRVNELRAALVAAGIITGAA